VSMGHDDEEYAHSIIAKMRLMLKKRGAEGITGLARNFRICDTDHSGKLNVQELSKCCSLCKLGLQDDEIRALHALFDTSGEVRHPLWPPRVLTKARADMLIN
jgi:Ca2+-binding EF-hand superfamily protein